MNKNKSMIKKIFLSLVVAIVVLIIAVVAYDKLTVTNQYYIGQKDLKIPVFLYHHIVQDESQVEFDYMQTTTRTFEKQIKGLKNEGYHFISYEDLKEYKEGKRKIYKKSCLLTFDDGHESVYENAYPIMKKYDVPFASFTITDMVGTTSYMTWEQMKEMQESGLATIASHSTKHDDFSKLDTENAVSDVEKSYEVLEENLGKKETKVFTYPFGLYTNDQIEKLKEKGYMINLTDNKINKSENLDINGLHRCYPLSDSVNKMNLKILYRSIRYN